MEAVRDHWTDERLDDLNRKVDDGFRRMDERFAQVDMRFDALNASIDARFDGVNARFGALLRVLIVAGAGLFGTMLVVATTLIVALL